MTLVRGKSGMLSGISKMLGRSRASADRSHEETNRVGASKPFETPNPFTWCLGQPPIEGSPSLGTSVAPQELKDDVLVERVQKAYRAACACHHASTSFWDTTIAEINKPIHDALLSETSAAQLLRNPAENSHFWGFDAICKAPRGEIEPHQQVIQALSPESDWRLLYAVWLHDALMNLSAAVGASRLFYPETVPGLFQKTYGAPSDIDLIFDKIETRIGKAVYFPNPYPGEVGLKSKRGVVSFRSLQALYQAWRLLQLAKGNADFRILEIGAGLGRTAFFARQFGLSSYTIADIPLTNAAQGYFLGRVLGEENVSLFGEERKASVSILPSESLLASKLDFDLVLNADSFTELAQGTTLQFWNFARKNASALLSINHEMNPHTVAEIYENDREIGYTRYPYWMRRGYVEEYFSWETFEQATSPV